MKASTLIRMYDLLKSEGYKPSMKLKTRKEFGWIEIGYKDNSNIHHIIISKIYSERYLLRKLNGIKFEIYKIRINKN